MTPPDPHCACPPDIQSRHLLDCPAMIRLDPTRRAALIALCERRGFVSASACVGALIDAAADKDRRIAEEAR